MTGPLDGPRAGSRAYLALKKLNEIGGRATVPQWMAAAGWTTTVNSFNAEVVDRLIVRRKIFVREDAFVISDDGLAHIGVEPDAPRMPPPALAGPRLAPPQRPLQPKNKVRVQLMREGAFDYLSIPSRHGSHVVEHKTSLKIAVGATQA